MGAASSATTSTTEPSRPSLASLRSSASHGNAVFTFLDLSQRHRGHIFPHATVDLVATWAASWAAAGWQPYLIDEATLQEDKSFTNVAARTQLAANRLVTAMNSTGVRRYACPPNRWSACVAFRRRGILQFYALAATNGGTLTDTDAINFGLAPSDVAAALKREAALAGGATGAARDRVLFSDGRKCRCKAGDATTRRGNYTRGRLFMTEAYSSGPSSSQPTHAAAAYPCDRIECNAVNNGLSTGSGRAYDTFVRNQGSHSACTPHCARALFSLCRVHCLRFRCASGSTTSRRRQYAASSGRTRCAS